MSDQRVGNLSGIARPTRKMRRQMAAMYGERAVVRFDKVLDDEVAIDAFSRLLTEAMEKCQTKDGRVDMRDVAVHVLREMKRNPK